MEFMGVYLDIESNKVKRYTAVIFTYVLPVTAIASAHTNEKIIISMKD